MANPDNHDKPAMTSLRPFVIGGGLLLAASLIVDLFVHHHGYFGFDGYLGFYAVFGFVAGLVIIGVAKGIGAPLKRPDTYYDDNGGEGG
jgi:hypothetical protein